LAAAAATSAFYADVEQRVHASSRNGKYSRLVTPDMGAEHQQAYNNSSHNFVNTGGSGDNNKGPSPADKQLLARVSIHYHV
jgi:hypothetical protein